MQIVFFPRVASNFPPHSSPSLRPSSSGQSLFILRPARILFCPCTFLRPRRSFIFFVAYEIRRRTWPFVFVRLAAAASATARQPPPLATLPPPQEPQLQQHQAPVGRRGHLPGALRHLPGQKARYRSGAEKKRETLRGSSGNDRLTGTVLPHSITAHRCSHAN